MVRSQQANTNVGTKQKRNNDAGLLEVNEVHGDMKQSEEWLREGMLRAFVWRYSDTRDRFRPISPVHFSFLLQVSTDH